MCIPIQTSARFAGACCSAASEVERSPWWLLVASLTCSIHVKPKHVPAFTHTEHTPIIIHTWPLLTRIHTHLIAFPLLSGVTRKRELITWLCLCHRILIFTRNGVLCLPDTLRQCVETTTHTQRARLPHQSINQSINHFYPAFWFQLPHLSNILECHMVI